jgi:release factor glutamine methyltransferase
MATFSGLEFDTAPGLVMTPRPSTEALVDAAAALVGERPYARIADVGTGTGAIAVALAHRLPHAEIWASDISADAVELAQANANRHGLGDRIHMVQGDLLEPIPAPVCLVVANLPYLPDELRDDPAYAEYRTEPPEALFSSEQGLAHYRRLLDAAEDRLDVDGVLVIQFHRRVLNAARAELDALRRRLERPLAA